MRRPLALRAEIAGCADDAAAQVMLPEAVDDDTCQQMARAVFRVANPISQRPATIRSMPALGGRFEPPLFEVGIAHEHLEEALGDDIAFLVRIAALEEMRVFQEIAALRVRA